MTTTTREAWLQRAIKMMRPGIEAAGLELPETVHASFGWPSRGGLSSKNRTIGQCWHCETSEDGFPHVFISPLIEEDVEVLAVLLHELIHACGIKGHRGDFARPARALGLEGKMTATVPGDGLREELTRMAQKLGASGHRKITPSAQLPKQGTRMLKVLCGECGYTVRTTQKWIDVGMPTCPCGTEMEEAT